MNTVVSFIVEWGNQLLLLLLESGSWLLFGFVAAGVLHCIGFAQYAQQFLIRPGLRSVLSASAIGIPLPLCSCSVIPVGIALRRKGASPGATASFFISTPQIGIDSFLLTVGLFGVPFAVARVLISFVSACLAGVLIDRFVDPTPSAARESASCCAKGVESPKVRFGIGIWFRGTLELMRDLRKYLAIGFVLAAGIAALVPVNSLDTWLASSWSSYLVAVLIGVPTYVCATASTPLAAVLLAKGVSAGAVLVFLMVGPATNIATIFALHKELHAKGVFLYIASIVLVAVLSGVMLDAWYPEMASTSLVAHAQHSFGAIEWLAAGLLLVLFAGSWLYRPGARASTSVCD